MLSWPMRVEAWELGLFISHLAIDFGQDVPPAADPRPLFKQ